MNDDESKYDKVDYVLVNGRERVQVTLMINGMLYTVMIDPEDLRQLMEFEQQKRRRLR